MNPSLIKNLAAQQEDIIRFIDYCFVDVGISLVKAIKDNEETKIFKLDIAIQPSVMKALGKVASLSPPTDSPEDNTTALSYFLSDFVTAGIQESGRAAAVRMLAGKEELKKEKRK